MHIYCWHGNSISTRTGICQTGKLHDRLLITVGTIALGGSGPITALHHAATAAQTGGVPGVDVYWSLSSWYTLATHLPSHAAVLHSDIHVHACSSIKNVE